MNTVSIFALKVLRKLYTKTFGSYKLPVLQKEKDPDKASEIIYNALSSNKPCMIARFGSTELSALVNYLGVNSEKHSVVDYIKGKQPEWWWNKNIMKQMQKWSGFFPPTPENLQRFGKMMINDSKEIDILGSWLSNEILFCGNLGPDKCVDLMLLEPFWSQKPWTRYLKGKKIVVVHPFKEDILSQYYNHRSQLFDNPMILPEFASLRVVKAVQSLGGENNGFRDWFEALQWMKDEIDKENYDVCLIGCGAYGLPLAAHVKRQGKQAIHLGGVLQLFFGIKGKRWNDKAQSHLYNKYWCSPISKPINYKNIEGGCYW